MTDQVTSIEQSKRLIELGVPADKASMVWEWGWVCGTVDEENYELKIWQECKMDKILAYQEFPESFIPAFTVADQQELLPVFIDAKGTFYLNISKCYEGWYVSYETESGAELISHRGIKLVDVLMDATEWLLSNGYKLNI